MARYRVEVAGEISARFNETIELVDLHTRRGRTFLTVDLEDQAALHGFFEALENVGVELVAVNPETDAYPPRASRTEEPSPG